MNLNKLSIKEEKQVSTSELIEILTKMFVAYNSNNIIGQHPAIFIQGQPGIGKSQAVKKVANNLEKETGKKVYLTDVRLLLFNPIDLRGIPVPNLKEQVAIWLKPDIFQLNQSKDIINILFLDELTAAPTSIQAAAYQIALDRRLGEHKIPDNTFIIAAGNRLEDNAVVYEMPTALRNRFIHFEVIKDLKSWLIWAKDNDIHPPITQFLFDNPDQFVTEDFDTSSNIIITPRSWETLSNILKTLGGTPKENETLVAAVLGNSLCYMLVNNIKGINVNEIIEGTYVDVPQDINQLQRITQILESQLMEYAEFEEKMDHVLNYIHLMPTDYALRVFKKILEVNIKNYDITKLQTYHSFISKLEELEDDDQ
jgi:hypothetical protein